MAAALYQMLSIDNQDRDDSWEPTVQRLFSSCTLTDAGDVAPYCSPHSMRTAFHIAMLPTSTETQYTALSYLATSAGAFSWDYVGVSQSEWWTWAQMHGIHSPADD